MPFFSTNEWLADVSKFWVWVTLTVPSTALAFAFYTYWKRRGEKAEAKSTAAGYDFLGLENGDNANAPGHVP